MTAFPFGTVGVVDTMIGFPSDPAELYAALRRRQLRDEVWPRFLRGNAVRVLGLETEG